MRKKEKNKNKVKKRWWEKLILALLIIIFVMAIIFTIIGDLFPTQNYTGTVVKEIEYLKKPYNVNDILSKNKISDNDISTAETALRNSGITFFYNGKYDDYFLDDNQSFIASATCKLDDYELGALFEKYINHSSSVDNLVTIEELTITKDEDSINHSIKLVLLFNLKNVLNISNSNNLGYLEQIYLTINTKAYVAPDNIFTITNDQELKINNLPSDQSKTVLNFINKAYTTENNDLNIEELSLNFFESFVNKIVSKTNTKLSLETTQYNNGIFTFSVV